MINIVYWALHVMFAVLTAIALILLFGRFGIALSIVWLIGWLYVYWAAFRKGANRGISHER